MSSKWGVCVLLAGVQGRACFLRQFYDMFFRLVGRAQVLRALAFMGNHSCVLDNVGISPNVWKGNGKDFAQLQLC